MIGRLASVVRKGDPGTPSTGAGMENAFRKFIESIFQNFSPPRLERERHRPERKPATTGPAADELPSMYEVGPRVARPGPIPEAYTRMSDLEFMAHLHAEAERLNYSFREAARRDIDPQPTVEAVTEADEFEDLRRLEIVRLNPTKLLPSDEEAEELEL